VGSWCRLFYSKTSSRINKDRGHIPAYRLSNKSKYSSDNKNGGQNSGSTHPFKLSSWNRQVNASVRQPLRTLGHITKENIVSGVGLFGCGPTNAATKVTLGDALKDLLK